MIDRKGARLKGGVWGGEIIAAFEQGKLQRPQGKQPRSDHDSGRICGLSAVSSAASLEPHTMSSHLTVCRMWLISVSQSLVQSSSERILPPCAEMQVLVVI